MKQVTLEVRYVSLGAFLEAMTDNTVPDRPLYLDMIQVGAGPSIMRVLLIAAFAEEAGDGMIMHRYIATCGTVLAGVPDPQDGAYAKAEKGVEAIGVAIKNYGWKRKSAIMLLPGENARDW